MATAPKFQEIEEGSVDQIGDDISGIKDLSVYEESLLHRKILVNGFINQNIIENIYMRMNLMMAADAETPITVIINSGGGNLYETLFIRDFIISCPTPVVTIGTAYCFSSAFVLFEAGHVRRCFPSTVFMLHDAKAGAGDEMDISTIKSYVKLLDGYENDLIDWFASRSNGTVKKATIKRKIRTDREWYIGAKEAVKLGFVDEVVGPGNNEEVW